MLVALENLSFGYQRDTVVEGIDLEINEGDFIGMIGPNGGGKSTIIKLILGLLKPWSGGIQYATTPDNERIKIGYLPQYHEFDQRFPINVLEVVLSGLLPEKKGLWRFSKVEKQKANNLLKQLGIKDIAQSSIGELSGGQMQRTFLGRALISNPAVLILDEPVTYVDNKFEQEMYEYLTELNKDSAILLVSHDVGQVSSYVKTIACVNRSLHYHRSNKITEEVLASYNCPIELITHGKVPHRVLTNHKHHD